MSLADYRTLVDKMVRAPGGVETIAATDRDAAIEAARLRYSQDCERELLVDVAWAEAGYFGPLPAGWTDVSYIRQAEYPVGEQPAALIPLEVYLTPTQRLLVVEDALPAGAVVRVTFAAEHLLTDGPPPATDTIPAVHREALSSYAASLLCGQLAALYSGERETPTNSDHSNTESRARNFSARAKEYRAAYYAGIGKADPRSEARSAAAAAGEPAASAGAWSGRTRNSLTRGSLL